LWFPIFGNFFLEFFFSIFPQQKLSIKKNWFKKMLI
jgi:hypothetical protein